MSLIGFSLGMNIFHFEAFPLSAGKYRFQATNIEIFGLVKKVSVSVQNYTILIMMGLYRSEILS
jgi:hypothetical protein